MKSGRERARAAPTNLDCSGRGPGYNRTQGTGLVDDLVSRQVEEREKKRNHLGPTIIVFGRHLVSFQLQWAAVSLARFILYYCAVRHQSTADGLGTVRD